MLFTGAASPPEFSCEKRRVRWLQGLWSPSRATNVNDVELNQPPVRAAGRMMMI